MAKVIPIFKKGDPCLINNYRPVYILPILSKVFEKLFLSRMLAFLNKHNQLSECQFGFRKGKSTVDAVVSLIDMVVEGLECRKSTLGVFLDLSKAFDCVDHRVLLDKLESHGIRGLPLQWLGSYISHRTQFVQISNRSSKLIKLCHGVPQGSILSPVLFLVYVNDVGASLQQGHIVQYADDTTLCFSDTAPELVEQQAFLELNKCIQHFNCLNLKVNSSKTNVMNFSLRPSAPEWSPSVMMGDNLLEDIYTVKFLGIHLDRGLTWHVHLDVVCAKLTSGIFVLRALAKYCPIQVLLMAYYGLIYPHLSYGVVLWGACSYNQFLRLFRLQKRAIRIIAGANFRDSCKPIFKQLKILTLPCLYIMETTTFFISKCSLTQGRDIHEHNTRGRDIYRTGRHRTVTFEHLPSAAGVHLYNRLPNTLKFSTTFQAFKTRLKGFLARHAFYNVDEFLANNWEAV